LITSRIASDSGHLHQKDPWALLWRVLLWVFALPRGQSKENFPAKQPNNAAGIVIAFG